MLERYESYGSEYSDDEEYQLSVAKEILSYDVVPDALRRCLRYDECINEDHHHLMFKLCAKDAQIARDYFNANNGFGFFVESALESFDEIVRIPIEYINKLDWLVSLTQQNMTCIKYPYYTNYVREWDDHRSLYLDREPSKVYMNNIPSFVQELCPGAVLVPVHRVTRDDVTYIVQNLAIDQIMDELDMHGFTPDMREFLRLQLSIDWLHDGALARALSARTDVPEL